MEVADARAADRRSEIETQLAALIDEYFSVEPEQEGIDCPLSVPLYGADEVMSALQVLLSQNVTMGARVKEFERAFSDFIGSRHAVMLNSGSSANLVALAILSESVVPNGLHPGDEVIVPAVTWPTTVTPIIQAGCVPVFVDIDSETLNLRPESLEDALSPRTRAIFVVHLLGNPVAMERVMDFARERDLWVLEDTCESLGSTVDGKHAGAFGHIGTFSFYFSHHITTVEGGMLVTDDDRLADLARSVRSHGWTRDMKNKEELESASPWIDPRFLFVHLGYNLRPMEVQAAFGLVQLERLAEFNEARRENARRLLAGLRRPRRASQVRRRAGRRSEHLVRIPGDRRGRTDAVGAVAPPRGAADRDTRDRRRQPRRPAGVQGQPHRTVGSLASATAIGQRGLFIGNHPRLDDRHIDHIVAAFHSFFEGR